MVQAGGVQERLKPAAVLSLLGYAVGLPVAFLYILVKHRASIHADQALKVAGSGGTAATNPHFHIRTRFQELYRCTTTCGARWWAALSVARLWCSPCPPTALRC